ncbi:MAG TPA: DNA polymerase III subunit delta [Gemmatimonadales bacterium]|nr:DNA polymerase III subunit delta [Gemmatimonadales bacterium]
MEALSLDELLSGLKHGAPRPVYYLHGNEDVLKDEAIRALLDRTVPPDARAFNVDHRHAVELDPEALDTLVNTPPMLALHRAVVLRGVDEVRRGSALHKALLQYLAAPNPTTLLILVQSSGEPADADLARHAVSVTIEALPANRVPRWLAHRAAALGVALDPQAQQLLLDVTGSDLQRLASELEKLAGLAVGRAVTVADVTATVGVRRGETMKDLVTAALGRDIPVAVQLVEPVLRQSGTTGVRIVNLLGTALVGTALARAELDRGLPPARLVSVLIGHMRQARMFGVPQQEEAERWAGWALKWSPEELRAALRRALAADQALKSSRVSDDHGLVVELLLSWGVVGSAVGEAA